MRDVHFYKNLKPVSDFNLLAHFSPYEPLPSSWFIVASDIENSTAHIKNGKFKEVNISAASVIAAISNHVKPVEIPFTFAGDGTVIGIPEVFTDDVQAIIESCKAIAKKKFYLNLVTGIVSVEELYQQGYKLLVAKIHTSEHITQAAFRGEGINRAEQIVKERAESPVNHKNINPDFSGLECRWKKFPARKEAVSLIVQATRQNQDEESEIYRQVLDTIKQVYNNEMELKPVAQQDMKLSFSPGDLLAEIKIRSHKGCWSRIKYIFRLFYMQLAGFILMKLDITTKNTSWGDYKPNFIKNSDYRKFSGNLKMIITGTTAQKKKLTGFLEMLFQQEKIVYGMHSSAATITTCFVTEYQNNHIHFIDGTDGGYTQASIDFKERYSGTNTIEVK